MADQEDSQTSLSLCMIVRDASRTLEPCLTSIRPWVNEMIVVDTGSVDESPEIAARLGAQLFHSPWCDDFSAARNESLRYARGDWVFWMDADDTIDADNGRKLRSLVDAPHDAAVWGYVVQVHCPAAHGSPDFTAVDHVKLFRNCPDLRFEGRIHEQILPAIRRKQAEVAWTDLFVVHSGSDQSPEGQRRKHERDLRILHLDLQDRPDHPFVLFNLGMTYADMDLHEEAVKWLRRGIELAGPHESHLRKAYALLAASLHQLARQEEAWRVCQNGLSRFPEDPELLFRQAMLAHEAGRLHEAAKAYQLALAKRSGRYFASVDQGILGCKARHNLACVYADMNRPELAEIQWRRILGERPDSQTTRRLLVEALLNGGRLTSAQLELSTMQNEEQDGCHIAQLQARLAELRGDLPRARHLLEDAAERFPEDAAAWEGMGRFLFDHGDPGEAVAPLSQLVRLQPENGAALHNLGLAQVRVGDWDSAVSSFTASLRVRPHASKTREQLRRALERLGLQQLEDIGYPRQESLAREVHPADSTPTFPAVPHE